MSDFGFANRIAVVLPFVIIGLIAVPAFSTDLDDAWTAWRDGNVDDVRGRLEGNDEDDAWRHLEFMVMSVSGEYEEALNVYSLISSSYAKIGELDRPYVEACKHLGRIDIALEFAKARGMDDSLVDILEGQQAKPLQVTLAGVTTIPFADHPLTQYLPAFAAELNGKAVTAHVDTGGTFLIMGPARAVALGIETAATGKGFHGSNPVDMRVGIADSFRLGDAVLENVPVATLASLKGSQDFVIFGTNLLEQFYSTLDYPRSRLILSPRRNEATTKEHRSMLPENVTRVPFYMWGDHYMFARGGVGEHGNLNLFIDSGLVSVHADGKGGTVPAAFTTTRKNFSAWGALDDDSKARHFWLQQPLNLGELEQDDLYGVIMSVGSKDFGGVRIDGLLSHAFLNQYAWTIDFDAGEYIFASE